MEMWNEIELLAQNMAIGLPLEGESHDPNFDVKKLITDRHIDALEKLISTDPRQLLDLPMRHYFSEGMYLRELFIPAGTFLTSWEHKTEHVCIVSSGSITVWSQENGTSHIKAPYTFISKPGHRRLGFAHENTVWTTVHATSERDLDLLEKTLFKMHDIAHPELTDAEAVALLSGGVE